MCPGLYTPTDGTAVIDGFDIHTDMDQIRMSMGICSQHNILFGRLTVLEHLNLFGTFKVYFTHAPCTNSRTPKVVKGI